MANSVIYIMALTCIPKLSRRNALEIYKYMGDNVDALFSEKKEKLKEDYPELNAVVLATLLAGKDEALKRATQEWEFTQKHHIDCLCYGMLNYPQRLLECDDAPLVLYYKGNADLNCTYSLAMVGTRKCSEYGKDMCSRITQELGKMRPDVLIVSGLAYGIDIHSHRGALAAKLNTVAVLAHGLDRIYPSSHRQDATQMICRGGLLTEYMTGTTPEKGNFLSRNRIVAGLSDGCLVVESANKGGSLVTARIALDYSRDVMAVPGRVGDEHSAGCNYLIKSNTAALVGSAEDILDTMNWPNVQVENNAKSCPIEQDLFNNLTDEEMTIVQLLQGSEGKQINQLVVESDMPVHRVSAILFELEMKNLVRLVAGGRYHLIK